MHYTTICISTCTMDYPDIQLLMSLWFGFVAWQSKNYYTMLPGENIHNIINLASLLRSPKENLTYAHTSMNFKVWISSGFNNWANNFPIAKQNLNSNENVKWEERVLYPLLMTETQLEKNTLDSMTNYYRLTQL